MNFRLQYKLNRGLSTALFLAVPLTLLAVFFLYPVGYTVYLSFHSWDGLNPQIVPVGLKNYKSIFQNPHFHTSLLNNAKWLLYFLTVPPGLGLLLALLLDKKKRVEFLKIVIFLPNAITMIAVAAIWRWIYNPGYGLMNAALRGMGLEVLIRTWLGDPKVITFSLMVSAAWVATGLPFIIYFAGLKNVPDELVDAARIDGANAVQRFRHILWPMLAPVNAIVLSLSALAAIRLFALVYALTEGGPGHSSSVLAIFMFDYTFWRFRYGMGAAAAVILFLLAFAIISPYLIYSVRKTEDIRQ